VSLAVYVSVTRNCLDAVAPTEVASNRDLTVTLVELLMLLVAASLNCRSTYLANALMAVPPVVVVPAIEVHVALS
jgi:hypothetical protein